MVDLKIGSIYFEKKRSRYTYSVYIDSKRYVLHNKDKQKLIIQANQFVDQMNLSENYADKRNVTLGQFVEKWLDKVKLTLSAKTYTNYEMTMRVYVIPVLGSKKLIAITNDDVQRLLNELAQQTSINNKKYSRNTLKSVRNILRVCLNSAIGSNYIVSNPIFGTKVPLAREKKEIIVLREVELKRLLEVARDGSYIYNSAHSELQSNEALKFLTKVYYYSILFAINTGCRYGEVFGLTWSDIDFDKEVITIRNNITEASGKVCVGLTKNRQTREIKVKKAVLEELQQWKEILDHVAEKYKYVFKNELDLVFPNSAGGFQRHSNFRKRCWLKLLAAAGIKKDFTFHCLRHTHITLLLKAGVPLADVSRRAGHSSPDVTLKIYTHVLNSEKDKAVEALEKMDF